jgi:FlaA1/EpsC-like NDP-sugar epimerase
MSGESTKDLHGTLLITGGTGSLGNAVLRRFLDSSIVMTH